MTATEDLLSFRTTGEWMEIPDSRFALPMAGGIVRLPAGRRSRKDPG